MSRMAIDANLCILCGKCVEACPFSGVEMGEGGVRFTDRCRLCQICVRVCPVGAPWLEREAAESTQDLAAYRDLLVFAEQRQGKLHPVTCELIGKGLELAGKLGQRVAVCLAGSGVQGLAEELLTYGVDYVYLYDYPQLEHFRIEPYTAIFVDLVRQVKPNIILMGATPIGRSLAPRVAARLRTGLTADCTVLDVKANGDLVQIRPAFGGDVMAQIVTPKHRPQMATVRHKVMAPASKVQPAGQIVRCQAAAELLQSRIDILGFRPHQVSDSITDAEVIVAGGRGLGRPEGLKLVERLAQLLGGTWGVTRPLVELGWAGYERQIGMSGRTVRPRLFLACGISGSVQFVAGMRGSDQIIAISSDPEAPIFHVAHYGLVGDLYEILPELIHSIEQGGSAGVP
jgi:electron transfer flavoprotein alpha subunit